MRYYDTKKYFNQFAYSNCLFLNLNKNDVNQTVPSKTNSVNNQKSFTNFLRRRLKEKWPTIIECVSYYQTNYPNAMQKIKSLQD